MQLTNSFWTSINYVVNFFTLSPFTGPGVGDQAPLLTSSAPPHYESPRGPVFVPPGGDPDLNFTCDYSRMSPKWTNCSTPENRGCWLRNVESLKEYNISTNYEDSDSTPIGIHRNYTLDLTDEWINADGMYFEDGKIFNETYPGPWIQACWGDVGVYFSSTILFLLLLPVMLSVHTNIMSRMSRSSSTTISPTTVLVFTGTVSGNG
jgi:hypothetical protein